MAREDVINGNVITLLSRQGIIDYDKVIESLKELTQLGQIDIELVNRESERGIVYLRDNGDLLNEVNEEAERIAIAKIIPTGYYEHKTFYPICAMLIKDGIGWSDISIGSCKSLYCLASERFSFKEAAVETYKQLSEYIDIRGDGWSAICEYNNEHKAKLNAEPIRFNSTCNTAVIETFDAESKREAKEAQEVREAQEAEAKHKELEEANADSVKQGQERIQNESTETASVVKDSAIHQLYNRLLVKECWNKRTLGDLTDYIKYLYKKVSCETSKTPIKASGNGYILSSDQSMVCINTGLLDCFGNDLMIVAPTNTSVTKFIKAVNIITSKSGLISLGFSKSSIEILPKPVKFYTDKTELIFSGDLKDFDLDSISKLTHIVKERKFRIPEKYSEMSQEAIAQMVKNSIIQGFRIADRDYRYFVPMFNFEREQIQFLAPIYLDGRLIGEPDVVAIIGETNGFYTLNTIITVEDAKNNARLLTLPGGIWLDS